MKRPLIHVERRNRRQGNEEKVERCHGREKEGNKEKEGNERKVELQL